MLLGSQHLFFRQQQLDSLIPYLLRAKKYNKKALFATQAIFQMGKLFQEIEMKASLLRASSQVFLKHDFTWDASWCESKQKIENISWRNLSFSLPTVCGSSRPNITLKQSYTTNLIIFYSSYNSYKCKYTLHAIFSHKNK